MLGFYRSVNHQRLFIVHRNFENQIYVSLMKNKIYAVYVLAVVVDSLRQTIQSAR